MPSIYELQQMQSLPLEVKILKTKARIKEWVDNSVYRVYNVGNN